MLGSVISSLEVVRTLKLMIKLAITSKGKRSKKDDPLSPILFNTMVDILIVMIEHIKIVGELEVIVLQYSF